MPIILVADDDPLLRELIVFKLEAAGFDVLTAADGEAAIAMTFSHVPDLVVLDTMMPVRSGPEVLRALKADPDTAPIPVIMLTARKGEADIVDALRGGAADYLTKPFLPDELAVRISAVLERSASAGSNARHDAA